MFPTPPTGTEGLSQLGHPWHIRPLTDGDQPAVRQVFDALSGASRLLRFHAPVPRYPSTWWRTLGRVRPGVADVALAWAGQAPIGHVMWTRLGGSEADLAVAVIDGWQHQGVGTALVAHAARTAVRAGITRFSCSIHPDNHPARRLARTIGAYPQHGGREWQLELADGAWAGSVPPPAEGGSGRPLAAGAAA